MATVHAGHNTKDEWCGVIFLLFVSGYFLGWGQACLLSPCGQHYLSFYHCLYMVTSPPHLRIPPFHFNHFSCLLFNLTSHDPPLRQGLEELQLTTANSQNSPSKLLGHSQMKFTAVPFDSTFVTVGWSLQIPPFRQGESSHTAAQESEFKGLA